MRGALLAILALSAATATAAVVPVTPSATKLTMGAPSLAKRTVEAGKSTTAKLRVRNRSGRKAAATFDFLLSRNAKRDRSDRRLTRKRVTAKPRRGAVASVTLKVPAATAPGAYRVLACLGKACKPSKALSVTRAGGPGGGGPGGGGPGGGGPAPGGSGDPAPSSGPFSPALDSARAATATIPANGGAIEATSANGTHFRLEIPDGALMEAQEITMTPLASTGGVPFGGGVVGAVQLAPDGLHLLTPARLVITPAQPVSIERQSPFGWLHDDDDLHNAPLEMDQHTIAISIQHFSGAGLASGSYEDRLAQAQKVLDDQAADFRNKAAHEINEARRTGDDVTWRDRVAQLLREYHAQVVAPDLTDALTDDAKWWLAAKQVVEFERTAHQTGLNDRLNPQFGFNETRMDNALVNHYQKAYERCVNDSEPEDGFTMWQDKKLVARAWAWEGPPALSDELLRKCLSFRIDLEGTMTARHSNGVVESMTVEAGAEGSSTEDGAAFTIDELAHINDRTFAPLQVTDAYKVDEEVGCSYSFTGQGPSREPVHLKRSGLDLDLNLIGNGSPEVAGLRIDLHVGDRDATIHESCPDGDGGTYEFDTVIRQWHFGWTSIHADERIHLLDDGPGWRTRNWARVDQGGVWAHKIYARTVQVDETTSYEENVRLILRHEPLP